MKPMSIYPLATVSDLVATRDFFVRHFGLQVIFEARWVVMLGRAGEDEIRLGFMTPDHPTRPPGPEIFDGRGMIVTVQVADAAQAFATLRDGGAQIAHALRDEPWGQRRFMARDPSGILVDVVEQIAPVEGWWEQYPAS